MVREIIRDEAFLSRKSGPYEAEEGCLSLTGTRKARRWQSIKVQYQNERFQTRFKTFTVLAANARWDRVGKFDELLDEFLSHVTDVKPITARQCVAALPEIAEAKPGSVLRIRTALEQADLSGYPDSMQPLVLKDIVAALQKIKK